MTNTPIELGSFWLPKQSSTVAPQVDQAWNAVYWVAVFFFVLVVTGMVVFSWRYRRKKEGEVTSDVDHNTALEVIWTPSTENDRMSSAELEVLYPELRRMDENTVIGRVFCGYCAQPFPAEILRCPSCGAPGTEAKRARA